VVRWRPVHHRPSRAPRTSGAVVGTYVPCLGNGPRWLTCPVFIGAESRLDVGFHAAQARLANLVRGGLLRRASGGAYHEWQADLARVGPWGTMLGMSRLVRVLVRDVVTRGDSAIWAMRWEVIGPGGALFPALDADIKLTPAGEDAATLAISGVYRPPLGSLGAGLDRAIMHRVAEATIRSFTEQIGTAIAHPAASPQAGHTGILPEAWPEPGTS
jgi:hypothetical protein